MEEKEDLLKKFDKAAAKSGETIAASLERTNLEVMVDIRDALYDIGRHLRHHNDYLQGR